ncbi:MAG TPA: TIGR03619 family F420-dependent LLM class oxidoreductase [Stellaceae bacterium]|nr:TIGR03619 family F420-dependent LLM class oxidoreductase [Stellaceae bacterium]
MEFGFNLPISGPLSSPEDVARIAEAGEALGYAYLTLTDHIVLPDLKAPGYPYSESGEFFGEGPQNRLEQLAAAAYVAARTRKIRLVMAVMVVPYRPALLAAKMLATIDVLSGGRLVLGIGAGWLQAEFDALGTPPFAERGAVTDEYLKAFRVLWTEAAPRFLGRHVRFDDILFAPKPVQKPHPPIWVGGESPPALRRAARLGDAWYPIGSNNRHLLDSLPRYRAGVARLKQYAAEAGRDPAAVALTYRVKQYGAELPPKASDGERRLFSGGVGDIVGDLRALEELGVGALDIDIERPSAEASMAELRRFRDEVLSRL